MAWVSEGWQSIVTVSAKDGSVVNVILKWDATVTTEALAETAYAAWATDFIAVSEGTLKTKSHQHGYYSDGFVLPSDDDAVRGHKAILVTGIEGIPNKTGIINLPFPKTDVVYESTAGEGMNTVDTDAALVLAYVDNWASGAATLSDGEKSAGNIIRGKRAGTPS